MNHDVRGLAIWHQTYLWKPKHRDASALYCRAVVRSPASLAPLSITLRQRASRWHRLSSTERPLCTLMGPPASRSKTPPQRPGALRPRNLHTRGTLRLRVLRLRTVWGATPIRYRGKKLQELGTPPETAAFALQYKLQEGTGEGGS